MAYIHEGLLVEILIFKVFLKGNEPTMADLALP